ncbi:MAG: SOS response-associated peptidase [Lachnospiraceae bacterium]|nr:SOS response-associated peptidase [Lachnospiraceae bacterium]
MCTRFYIEPETEELKAVLKAVQGSRLVRKFLKAGDAVLTSGEIRPSNVVPAIAPDPEGRPAVYPMRWGFKIPEKSLIVNARSETAAEKYMFREAWKKHRCVIPASWYYEWEHLIGSAGQKVTGRKFMIQPRNTQAAYLAGLYRIEDGLPVFTVLTRDAEGEMKRIHDRMPVILPRTLIAEWVRPDGSPEHVISKALRDVIAEVCP